MKRPLHNTDDELLVKYLLDEASDTERRVVEDWISDAPSNKKYFDHFQLIWHTSREVATVSQIDEDAAWLRFQQRINRSSTRAVVIPMKKRYNWLGAAAVVIIMLGLFGIYRYITYTSLEVVTYASNDAIVIDTLPDQSVVTLNKHSSLNYDERTSKGHVRKAKLKGEAFFNVAPDKTKPFVIDVDGLEVKVVGTSFNIKSLSDRTEVVVESGIVNVIKGNQSITLIKGERLAVPKIGKLPSKQKTESKLYNYYRSREFVCDNTPLWQLVQVLNEAYETNIIIETEAAKNYKLNATFPNQSIDTIMSIIGETFDLKVEKKNGRYIIR
ncbi:MAG: FecR domain-containing protein [Flavitalea sp.]